MTPRSPQSPAIAFAYRIVLVVMCGAAQPYTTAVALQDSRGAVTPGTLVIRNVAVIPITRDTVVREATVVVRDGRIASLDPGEPVAFQRCDSLTLGLPGWSLYLAPVAVFDVNALLPAELPHVDGVLALDAFDGQVLTIDWPGERVIIHAPTTGASALAPSGYRFVRPLVKTAGC